jgi:hypothetical protein
MGQLSRKIKTKKRKLQKTIVDLVSLASMADGNIKSPLGLPGQGFWKN